LGLQEILWTIQNIPGDWRNLVDILLVAVIFFAALQLARGTRAATLLRGIALVLVAVWGLSTVLRLQAFSFLLSRLLTATFIALPVIFQEEIRRWLDRIGRFGLLDVMGNLGEERQQNLIDELCDAVRILSRSRHGALIAVERDIGLQEYIDSGVAMDALITSQLLQTAFYPKTALHDGAVIIRGDRAVAAACTLPVSSRRNMPDRSMGLRHRAGLGLSEVSDAIVVIVSEETGYISIVTGGRFIRGIDADRLASNLSEFIKSEKSTGLLYRIREIRDQFMNKKDPSSDDRPRRVA